MVAPFAGFCCHLTIERRRGGPTGTVLLAALVGLSGPASGFAQFASGVNVVEVYATVTDEHGKPVTGLTKDDFVVREDGRIQRVDTFAAGEFPLSVAVAVDRSFSMAGSQLAMAKSAARIFLGELRPGDQSMLLAIGSSADVIAPLSQDRSAQFPALAGLDAFGTTGLYDAILRAIDAVQPAKGRRALVLLSDGSDRYSEATAAEVLARARASDVLMYPVAIGHERPEIFAEIAALTGGRSFHVRDARKLPDVVRTIGAELRHQYLLGYTPSQPIAPGSGEWRSIDVAVDRPKLSVRARDGYLIK